MYIMINNHKYTQQYINIPKPKKPGISSAWWFGDPRPLNSHIQTPVILREHYKYIPGTQMTSIFEGQPLKTRPKFQLNQGAPFGFQVSIPNTINGVVGQNMDKVVILLQDCNNTQVHARTSLHHHQSWGESKRERFRMVKKRLGVVF